MKFKKRIGKTRHNKCHSLLANLLSLFCRFPFFDRRRKERRVIRSLKYKDSRGKLSLFQQQHTSVLGLPLSIVFRGNIRSPRSNKFNRPNESSCIATILFFFFSIRHFYDRDTFLFYIRSKSREQRNIRLFVLGHPDTTRNMRARTQSTSTRRRIKI